MHHLEEVRVDNAKIKLSYKNFVWDCALRMIISMENIGIMWIVLA